MTYRLAIFDYDGTLADSHHAIMLAMAGAVRAHGGHDVHSRPVADWIGLPLHDMVRWMIAEGLVQEADLEPVVAHFRAHYPALCTEHTRLYDGMREVLERTRAAGRLLAIATNKGAAGLHNSMRSLDLVPLFHTLRNVDMVQHVKPHPEMLLSILDELKVPASEAVMVGDTIYDMEMGRRAGVATVAVTYGMHGRERLQALQPTHMVAQARQLLRILAVD